MDLDRYADLHCQCMSVCDHVDAVKEVDGKTVCAFCSREVPEQTNGPSQFAETIAEIYGEDLA